MLDFLYYPIAWVLKMWHLLWGAVFDPHSGASWVLSIMFLVITVRILLFPVFVKMIKSQRAMQELAPEIQKLRAEYGSDRQGMSEAMMKLQRERGVNPLAGCLPMLLQAPVFIALLHVLRRLEPGKPGLYSWDDALTDNAATAQVFGAPISSFFTMSGERLQALVDVVDTTPTNIKVVTGVLIVVMSITQFITTKQIMKRTKAQNAAMAAANPQQSQMEVVQKLMLYGAPIALLITGTFFPLGVLLYWFFNNLWTIAQQFWVLKRMPAPGARSVDKDAPEIDRTKLAPRPGAKPVNRVPKGHRAASSAVAADTEAEAAVDDAGDSVGEAARTTGTSGASKGAPRAGSKPKVGSKASPRSRPGARSRPQAKRKKR